MHDQKEITENLELLDKDGKLTREGYARLPYWRYRRKAVKAPLWRIKEWDYYYLRSDIEDCYVCLTMSDLGYAGLFAAAFVDAGRGQVSQTDEIIPFSLHRTGLAEEADADGRVAFSGKKLSLEFTRSGAERLIRFSVPGLECRGGMGLEGELTLDHPPEQERLVIATSWAENRRAFYFDQKMVCMPVSGQVRFGGGELRFETGKSWAGLDWGRGRWPRESRWYWASASTSVDGRSFGFNLGYGFSDRTPASEDMAFLDGKAHKLGRTRFEFDTGDYLKPWRIRSDDGSFEAEFRPQVIRSSDTDLKLIASVQRQVFGRFTGRVRLEDGTSFPFADVAGFAEDVFNRW